MKASKLIDFNPKILSTLKNYSREKLSADIMAGMIVGVVAIPLAIAFGIASGVGPTEGLVTAIIAGLLISVLGGSKVQIGGPTGAFIVIVYGIIQGNTTTYTITNDILGSKIGSNRCCVLAFFINSINICGKFKAKNTRMPKVANAKILLTARIW